MEAIKKLRDRKIFNDQSIVESMIEKTWMGSPVIKRSLLRVKTVAENHCALKNNASRNLVLLNNPIYPVGLLGCQSRIFEVIS